MGCFFSCFPVRNEDHRGPHLVSDTSNCSKSTQEILVSKNRLSTLFLAEEKGKCESNVAKFKDCDSPQINKEIRDEPKFLKACGTLQDTPIEIRKGFKKFKASPSKFDSCQPDFAVTIDRSPTSATPSSCISNVYNSGRISNEEGEARSGEANENDDSTSSIPPWPSAINNTRGRIKSVQFECDLESSLKRPSGDRCQISIEFDSSGDQSISKDYPKPTPLKISDEMQTPETSFLPNLGILAKGKTMMKNRDVVNEALKLESGEKSSVEDLTTEGSLSSWFKPKSKEDNNKNAGNISRLGRTPVDRPIIGMVAAHWNENEVSNISPKWWDGNGIPNSTNKYKEDQKVSWHATPFEERLEKALSEESLISEKKHINGTPIIFHEYDQRDTASSHLQASTHAQSVVSF